MQFVESFVVLSWSVSLRLGEFYPRMRFLLNFLRFYSIFSDVLEMNVAGSGGTNIYFRSGCTCSPCPPGSDASEWTHE